MSGAAQNPVNVYDCFVTLAVRTTMSRQIHFYMAIVKSPEVAALS